LSIIVTVVVGEFAYGNPGSLGEPLGLWGGQAEVTGDATGGFVLLNFVPRNPVDTPTLVDARRQYVYFVDGLQITTNTTPGNVEARIRMHMARSNQALTPPFEHVVIRTSLQSETNFFGPSAPLMDDYMTRTPIFWDTQELASTESDLVILNAQTNTNLTLYNFKAYGRYYDRQILSNRAFGRLIAPPAVSQFG